MEIEMRKMESYTIVESTQSVKLNVEEFRLCIPPFVGSSEEDFFNYFNENLDYIDDFIEDNKEILSEETCDNLATLDYDGEMNVINDSRNKYGDIWFEYGKTNKEFTKNGEFETLGSSNY